MIYETVRERPLVHSVQQRQLRWLGHALRRDEDEPAKIFALYEPAPSHGSTNKGRPSTSYKQYIAGLLTTDKKDITTKQIEDMASDRTKWGKRVAEIGKKKS